MTSTKHTLTFVQPGVFFALTFALSWLIWIPLTLSHLGIGPFQISEEISLYRKYLLMSSL